MSPVLGVIVWLVTQRGLDDPWRNTLILIPLRLCFTGEAERLFAVVASFT